MDRLLGDREHRKVKRNWYLLNGLNHLADFMEIDMPLNNLEKQLLQAQDTKTRELTLKEVMWLVNNLFDMVEHGDYSNGIEAFGIDEGRVQAGELLSRYRKQWQTLQQGKMPDSKGKED